MLRRNQSANLTIPINYDGIMKIENELQYMQYEEYKEEDGAIFVIQKKNYITNYHIGFDLRYYNSYSGFKGSRSGAAIFRP